MAVQFFSYCLQGLSALPVNVEVDVSPGMPIFNIIGMAGTSVQEAKDRVRSAIVHSGFTFPLTRKVVNLAPAELPKHGSHFDLPMALGFLVLTEQMPPLPSNVLALGELGLNGSLRPVSGVLPAVSFAQKKGIEEVILPRDNLMEGRLVKGIRLIGATHLTEVVGHFSGRKLVGEITEEYSEESLMWTLKEKTWNVDFADISGHATAKRSLTVAAAGGHHVLLSGPPGSGKSLLAEAFPGLLPPLSPEELLEVLRIHSVAGRTLEPFNLSRPFRRIHPRSTAYALLGGGVNLMPGEVSLAHRGVLFMDEFPEFDRESLEALRQPLECRELLLKYGKWSCVFPCQFQLIAARNPCPCGHFGDAEHACRCNPAAIARYQNKISGPIVDRIDLHVEVPRLAYDDFKLTALENSKTLQEKVMLARERQRARLKEYGLFLNQEMTPRLLKEEKLDGKTEDLLKSAVQHYGLSGRAIHRLIKVARTLADLDGVSFIHLPHLMEALQYRVKSP